MYQERKRQFFERADSAVVITGRRADRELSMGPGMLLGETYGGQSGWLITANSAGN